MKGVRFVDHIFKMNDITLIINNNVFQKLIAYCQYYKSSPESGGLLIGRTNINGITRIYEITEPMDKDIRNRIAFIRKGKGHLAYISEANERCLYFKGNWHTHPQDIPTFSWLDRMSWNNAIRNSKPGNSEYIFFIIVGILEIKIWCGSMRTSKIEEMEYQIV